MRVVFLFLMCVASVANAIVIGWDTVGVAIGQQGNWKLTSSYKSVVTTNSILDTFFVYYASGTPTDNELKIGIYKKNGADIELIWQDSMLNRPVNQWNKKIITGDLSVNADDTIYPSIVTPDLSTSHVIYIAYNADAVGNNWFQISGASTWANEMVDPHQSVSSASQTLSFYVSGHDAPSCEIPTGTDPSNRVDTIAQYGKFALAHDGCEPDSFRFINKGSLDSVALVATKDSVAHRLKNLQKTAVPCSLSLWYGGAAVDTVTWTWRVTGPTAAFSATRDTLTVGVLDTTHQTIPDSLTDSVTCASPPAGLSIFKTGANMGDFYGTLEHLTTYYPMVVWWRGGVAADSARDTIIGRWDPLVIDSIRPDTLHVGDTGFVYLSQANKIRDLDSIDFEGTKATLIDTVGDTLSFIAPDKIGSWGVVLCDTVSCSDTDTVVIIAAPVVPDTFTATISITGNHLTEPDIDTTPFTADGRYETGTEITITATQAALHKLIPTATFPASPLVFTITRDTTIIIQSDTFPKFTRDTIIVGGHATVAVAPVTLTPVDSATACTTSVPAVDEGWRVDSIVHYSGGARVSAVTYPATQIAYLITGNTVDSIFMSEIPAVQYTLTMATIGTGTVTPSAGDTTVDSASGFAITATPGVGYTFTGWTTVSGTILFNIDSSRCSLSTAATLRANFTIKTYTVTSTVVGNGTAAYIPVNDSVADSLGTVRLYGIADAGNVFTGFSNDTAGMVRVGDTATFIMTANRAITLTFAEIPVIDSIRPGPKANRNDSCTAYGRAFGNAGRIRNSTAGVDAVQKSWANTQVDFYTAPTWPRGWNTLIFTNSDSLKDTGAIYITIPRKTN